MTFETGVHARQPRANTLGMIARYIRLWKARRALQRDMLARRNSFEVRSYFAHRQAALKGLGKGRGL